MKSFITLNSGNIMPSAHRKELSVTHPHMETESFIITRDKNAQQGLSWCLQQSRKYCRAKTNRDSASQGDCWYKEVPCAEALISGNNASRAKVDLFPKRFGRLRVSFPLAQWRECLRRRLHPCSGASSPSAPRMGRLVFSAPNLLNTVTVQL